METKVNKYYEMIVYTWFFGFRWKRKVKFNSLDEANNYFYKYGAPDNYVLYEYTEKVRSSS